MAALEDVPFHTRVLLARLGRHLFGHFYCNLEAEGPELIAETVTRAHFLL